MKRPSSSLLALLITAASLTGCATMMGPVPSALTDAEIARIVMNANQGEIQQGQIATARASTEAVRDFANMLVRDHIAANHRAGELTLRANITPADNEVSRQIAANASRTAETLGTWRGSEFDRTFMDTQIQFHQWLLTTIDENLIPSARNEELRALLETQRVSVATHLARAQQIRSNL